MESTALILLTLSAKLLSTGVMFGWQPMPDDAEKVEYIVQIEPELAATLQAGQSIPITSDIPDDIGPIGRIRIVVGRDELPRQNLVTSMKPWPVETSKHLQSDSGIVETQFTTPASGSGRYGNTSNGSEILPPSGNGQPASNPFGQALQQGAEEARNLANNASNEILPPSSDQLFGSSGDVRPGVQGAINNTTNQLQRDFNRGVEQVADRTGQQLREAVNSVGQRASEAVDEFGRSLSSDRSIVRNTQATNDAAILPPGSSNDVNVRSQQPINTPQQPQRQAPQRDQSSSSFAGSTQQGSNPTSPRGVFDAPWPPTQSNVPPASSVGNSPTTRYGNQQPYKQPNFPPRRDNFDIASRSTSSGLQNYGASQPTGLSSSGNGMEGPELNLPSQQYDQPAPNLASQRRAGPAITRDMLNDESSNDGQLGGANQNYPQQQVTARQPLDTQPRDFGWNQQDQSSQNNGQGGNNSPFLFALAWVLATGSGAGNLYLFWSYLDVRSKYQGVVHGSPVRRDRYDD